MPSGIGMSELGVPGKRREEPRAGESGEAGARLGREPLRRRPAEGSPQSNVQISSALERAGGASSRTASLLLDYGYALEIFFWRMEAAGTCSRSCYRPGHPCAMWGICERVPLKDSVGVILGNSVFKHSASPDDEAQNVHGPRGLMLHTI